MYGKHNRQSGQAPKGFPDSFPFPFPGKNFPFRRTVVNLDILEVIPAEKVKAMSTQELSACCRNRIAGHLGEEVEE